MYLASDGASWYALGAPLPLAPPGEPVAGTFVATGRPGTGPFFAATWGAPATGSPVDTYSWSIAYFSGAVWLPVAGGTTAALSVDAPYAYTRGLTYRIAIYGTNTAGSGPTLYMSTVA